MLKRIVIKCADIVDFPCDVLVLKFAQSFYGADELVSTRLTARPVEEIRPLPRSYVLLPSHGKIAAKDVLFVGVPPLDKFEYQQIREFASYSLQILGSQTPDAEHIAMTIHGIGYGLDEKEVFLAQLAGILDAFRGKGDTLSVSRRISIVENDRSRAARLRRILNETLPSALLTYRSRATKQVPRVPRISAGRNSKKKPHVFVAMPFSDDMEDVYVFGIQGPVNAAGFLCERVDMAAFTGDMLARIKSRIENAALVIADLTGANPNVYLEVGYAWGKDRPTLLISKGSDELKFDVRGQRTLIYRSISDLAKKLASDLMALKQKPAPSARYYSRITKRRTAS